MLARILLHLVALVVALEVLAFAGLVGLSIAPAAAGQQPVAVATATMGIRG
jgi:hypothetical protein